MKIELFTGGMLETNAYYLPEIHTLIDAPEGVVSWLEQKQWPVKKLLLTHGHYDHIWDADLLRQKTGCKIYYHRADEPLLTNPEILLKMGFMFQFPPLPADEFLEGGEKLFMNPFEFLLLHIPGHCPGSICFYEAKEKVVFGGDVLFAGGVGRWDLPGGSQSQLFEGIRSKLLTLPDEVRIFPGHGPDTTIGIERKTNPYLTGF